MVVSNFSISSIDCFFFPAISHLRFHYHRIPKEETFYLGLLRVNLLHGEGLQNTPPQTCQSGIGLFPAEGN